MKTQKEMREINVSKQYAIYFRFNEITNDIKQRLGRGHINLIAIHEQIADEFGYKSTRMVTEAINFIRKNITEPFIRKEALLFSQNRINYWRKYDSEKDLQNIEEISRHTHLFFGKTCGGKRTKTPFIHYFIYMQFLEYEQNQEGKVKKHDIYELLADEFYYRNADSIRNIVKKVSEILCGKTDKKYLRKTKDALST